MRLHGRPDRHSLRPCRRTELNSDAPGPRGASPAFGGTTDRRTDAEGHGQETGACDTRNGSVERRRPRAKWQKVSDTFRPVFTGVCVIGLKKLLQAERIQLTDSFGYDVLGDVMEFAIVRMGW